MDTLNEWMAKPEIWAYLCLVVVLAWATVTDIRSRRIPNRLTFPSMLAGIAFHLLTAGTPGLVFSLSGLALGMGIFIIYYACGIAGAGDAKLMGVVGAVMGVDGVVTAYLFTTVIAGVHAFYVIFTSISWEIVGRKARALVGGVQTYALTRQLSMAMPARDPGRKRSVLALAPSVALGTLAAMVWRLTGHEFFDII